MLNIQNLTKNIKGHQVLKGINLKIDKGDVIAIIGPSGGGKTSLLRCLNALEIPDSGKFDFSDNSLSIDFSKGFSRVEILKLRRKMGMVFQQFNLFPHKTALENVCEGLLIVKNIDKEKAILVATELLEQMGLRHKLHLYPSALSGGQQQRVAIARAMALNPDILLLDEPTSALDKELVGEVLTALKILIEKKQTMVLITHELNFAKEVANKIIFLENGQILTISNPIDFFKNQKNERILKFLGDISI